jgi:DNA-directed RNA polymerase subunit RPC12/RpoP
MWNSPSKEQLAKIPALYATEHIPLKDKVVYFHFFIGNCDWYVMEFDGNDTFWGFAILNNDYEMAEFGYFNFHELADIRVKGIFEIENDTSWQVRPASKIEKICRAQGWTLPDLGLLEIECPCCKKTISSDSARNEIHCPECKVIILQRHINSVYRGGRYGLHS